VVGSNTRAGKREIWLIEWPVPVVVGWTTWAGKLAIALIVWTLEAGAAKDGSRALKLAKPEDFAAAGMMDEMAAKPRAVASSADLRNIAEVVERRDMGRLLI
jgi:hypothetical protein